MRAHVAQYLNEVVSLAVLALMGLAVVSGQAASATLAETMADSVGNTPTLMTEQFAEQLVEQVGTNLDLKLEISFRHEGE